MKERGKLSKREEEERERKRKGRGRRKVNKVRIRFVLEPARTYTHLHPKITICT